MNKKTKWIHCPVCGNKTRDRIREDTVLNTNSLVFTYIVLNY